jgi:hypothetical protein
MNENLKLIRDIKLNISIGELEPIIDLNQLPGFFYFLSRKRKIINYLFENGAVLTGSRALKCYSINGKRMLNREPNDWDFLVTQDQFIKLCGDYDIYDFKLNENKYYMNRSFAVFVDSYGSISNWFPCFIQLVIVDELNNFIEKDNKRLSTLTSIIDNKIKLISESCEVDKHQEDLNNILVNTYFI